MTLTDVKRVLETARHQRDPDGLKTAAEAALSLARASTNQTKELKEHLKLLSDVEKVSKDVVLEALEVRSTLDFGCWTLQAVQFWSALLESCKSARTLIGSHVEHVVKCLTTVIDNRMCCHTNRVVSGDDFLHQSTRFLLQLFQEFKKQLAGNSLLCDTERSLVGVLRPGVPKACVLMAGNCLGFQVCRLQAPGTLSPAQRFHELYIRLDEDCGNSAGGDCDWLPRTALLSGTQSCLDERHLVETIATNQDEAQQEHAGERQQAAAKHHNPSGKGTCHREPVVSKQLIKQP